MTASSSFTVVWAFDYGYAFTLLTGIQLCRSQHTAARFKNTVRPSGEQCMWSIWYVCGCAGWLFQNNQAFDHAPCMRHSDCSLQDPAAEEFQYQVSLDVRELISLEDAMEEMQLGPNGALLYCMEYLSEPETHQLSDKCHLLRLQEESLDEWLQEELKDFSDDDYLLFDCPGQIELYSHVPVFRTFVDSLRMWDFKYVPPSYEPILFAMCSRV
eukprot:617696-Prorocentrum_minimum.AAC.1